MGRCGRAGRAWPTTPAPGPRLPGGQREVVGAGKRWGGAARGAAAEAWPRAHQAATVPSSAAPGAAGPRPGRARACSRAPQAVVSAAARRVVPGRAGGARPPAGAGAAAGAADAAGALPMARRQGQPRQAVAAAADRRAGAGAGRPVEVAALVVTAPAGASARRSASAPTRRHRRRQAPPAPTPPSGRADGTQRRVHRCPEANHPPARPSWPGEEAVRRKRMVPPLAALAPAAPAARCRAGAGAAWKGGCGSPVQIRTARPRGTGTGAPRQGGAKQWCELLSREKAAHSVPPPPQERGRTRRSPRLPASS